MQNTTVPSTRKNINFIPAETRIVFLPYSKPYMSSSNPTLSNTSWLIIITFPVFSYTPRYSFISLWVVLWINLVHEFGLHLSQQSFREGKMICGGCWSQFWFCHCWTFIGLVNLFFINPDNSYCSNVYMTYSNPSGDEIQYYAEIDILQFKSLSSLSQNPIPVRYISEFPTLLHTHQVCPSPWAKKKSWGWICHSLGQG